MAEDHDAPEFAAPGILRLPTTVFRNDPNLSVSRTANPLWQSVTGTRGGKLEVIDVPLTSREVVHINFYVCAAGVIVSGAVKAEEDDQPLAILQEVSPRHMVVPITGHTIAKGGGGAHCTTQRDPAV